MINKNYFMLCDKIEKKDLKNLNSNWKANIKYDGERIIAIKKDDNVFLINRRGREKSLIYPEIAKELKNIDGEFIFDGEIITTDGLFNSLQHRSNLSDRFKIQKAIKDYPIIFMIFDILKIDSKDLTNEPLKERIEYLKNFFLRILKIKDNSKIGFVAYEDINECLEYAENNNCEGIIVKDINGFYEHRRSHSWLKLKFFKTAELKVIKYTENPKGIRVEDKNLNAVQITGIQHKEVKEKIDKDGYCDIYIQYLEKTKENRFRFISYKGIERKENEI